MDQLKAQVVFGEEFVVEARAPAVPGDLHSNPVYFCDTMEADVEEGRGRAEDNPAEHCRGCEGGLCGEGVATNAKTRCAGLVRLAV